MKYTCANGQRAAETLRETALQLSELLAEDDQLGHHAAVPLGAGDFERGHSIVDLIVSGGCTVGDEDLRGLEAAPVAGIVEGCEAVHIPIDKDRTIAVWGRRRGCDV